jgi:O-antigen ligase
MVELIYALFLLSGIIKFFLIFLAGGLFPIDFTLFCAIILFALYAVSFFKNAYTRSKFHIIGPTRPLITAVLALYLWMVVTLLYTHSPSYCYTKLFMFLTILAALGFPFLYRGFDPRRFLNLYSYIGSGLVFIYSALLPTFFAGYMSMFNEEDREFVVKYLDIGHLAGIMILLLAFACPRMKPLIKAALIGINLWAVLISAARGPIVFLLLVLLLKFAAAAIAFIKRKGKFQLKYLFYTAAGFGIFGAGAYYMMDRYAELIERTLRRLTLVLDTGSSSVAKRFDMLSFTIGKIFENAWNFLMGLGIGSFGILFDGIDERNYPHNVVLELWFEIGIIGVILFVIILIIYLKKLWSNFNFLLVYLYLLLNIMKSSSLVDSRIMFGTLSALVLYDILEKKQKDNAGTAAPEN